MSKLSVEELEELIFKIDLMLSDTRGILESSNEGNWNDFLQRI
jgi:hypothetical protein